LSYNCLIVALYPRYDSPAGRGVPLAYVSFRHVPDNPRRGTLNIPFVGRSGPSKQTQEVVPQCVCMFAYACVSECMYVVLPNLICYNPQQLSILKLRPTRRPSGNRAPAPQISMLRQGRAKEKQQNTHTHTSCVNIEFGGAGAGDPHKFRFENLSLSIESGGWPSSNIIRPGRNVFR
jgi:hypothetical protein